MASLRPFFSDGVEAGMTGHSKAKEVVWITVGTGVLKVLTDYEVALDNHVDLKFYEGDLNIHVTLLDEDAAAKAGPARVQLNAHVDEAGSYEVDGHELVLKAIMGYKQQKITLSRTSKNQTEARLEGSRSLTVHIVPD